MRRLVVAVAIALGLVAAPTAGATVTDLLYQQVYQQLVAWDSEMATLAPSATPSSGHDFAVGSHKVTQPSGNFQHVRVSAHSGPGGEDPKGSVRVTFQHAVFPGGVGDVKGDVVCLNVTGNRAQLVAVLREPHQGFTHVTLLLGDFGNPGATMGQSPDDALIGFTSSPQPPLFCANEGTTLGGDASGNIVVRDAVQ